MSAAPAAVPGPISRARRGWFRIPRAFYEVAAGELAKSEHVILGLGFALVQFSRKTEAVIPIDRFARGARISNSAAYQCTKELDRADYMRFKVLENGDREYRPKMQEVRSGMVVEGKCENCGAFTSGDIVTGFVPTPYPLMLKLGAACSSQAAWLCALKIWHETGDLDESGDHVVTKTKLDWMIVDFEEATGLSRRSVQEGLSELAALKVLKSEPNPQDARRRLYWLDLDALDKIKPRAWQTCEQPPRKPPVISPTIDSSGEIEVTEGEASVSAAVGAREYTRGQGEQKAAPEPPEASANAGNISPTGAAKFTGRLIWARCWSCSTVAPFRETIREPQPEAPPAAPTNPQTPPQVNPMPEIERDDFAMFLEACHTAQMGSQVHIDMARTEWVKLTFEEKLAACKGIRDRIACGEFDDPVYRPRPMKYLKEKIWQCELRIRREDKRGNGPDVIEMMLRNLRRGTS